MTRVIVISFCLILCLNTIGLTQNSGTFIDNRDGQEYKWVKIGKQIWMAENLNFAPKSGSKRYGVSYGIAYNWETARKVCPRGWHLPSDEEWKQLESYIGLIDEELNIAGTRESGKVGLHLKSKIGWDMYFGKSNGVDTYGFRAIPGGLYSYVQKRFMYYGTNIHFWTSSFAEKYADQNYVWIRELVSNSDGINRDQLEEKNSCYCRCVED